MKRQVVSAIVICLTVSVIGVVRDAEAGGLILYELR